MLITRVPTLPWERVQPFLISLSKMGLNHSTQRLPASMPGRESQGWRIHWSRRRLPKWGDRGLPSLPPVPPTPNPLSPPPACTTGPCSRGVSAAALTFPARDAPAREVAPGGGAPRSSTGPVAAQCLRLCNTEWWGGNGVADWLPISEEKRQLLDQIRIYLLLTLFLEYSSSSLVSLQPVKLAWRHRRLMARPPSSQNLILEMILRVHQTTQQNSKLKLYI